jgi:hypothetical protein
MTTADKREIKRQLSYASELTGSDRNICWIQTISEHRVLVYTGEVFGPLAGSGRVVAFVKTEKGWRQDRTEMIGFWNS